jgi:hypothetical protein
VTGNVPRVRQVLDTGGDGERRLILCSRCGLAVAYTDGDVKVVVDLLASHWADDHHLPSWRDTAAGARDRLWRRRPELLEMLTDLSGPHNRAG